MDEPNKQPEIETETVVQSKEEEYLNNWKRERADFMNYKKEQDKTMALIRLYANEDLLLRFLPILDSLEKAMEHMPPELEGNLWAQGIKSIRNQIGDTIKSIGVSEIPARDEKFDPYLHEAIAQAESDKDDGTVLEEFQKGYTLHGKVLRHAKVKISAGKKQEEKNKENDQKSNQENKNPN